MTPRARFKYFKTPKHGDIFYRVNTRSAVSCTTAKHSKAMSLAPKYPAMKSRRLRAATAKLRYLIIFAMEYISSEKKSNERLFKAASGIMAVEGEIFWKRGLSCEKDRPRLKVCYERLSEY